MLGHGERKQRSEGKREPESERASGGSRGVAEGVQGDEEAARQAGREEVAGAGRPRASVLLAGEEDDRGGSVASQREFRATRGS